jgi:hypothetical protein
MEMLVLCYDYQMFAKQLKKARSANITTCVCVCVCVCVRAFVCVCVCVCV